MLFNHQIVGGRKRSILMLGFVLLGIILCISSRLLDNFEGPLIFFISDFVCFEGVCGACYWYQTGSDYDGLSYGTRSLRRQPNQIMDGITFIASIPK